MIPVGARPALRAMRFGEFVVLTAAMMATQAIAVDSMLPALPAIGRAMGVLQENHRQWIVTAYVAGMGCGQLFWGLLSDRFGRRPILLVGLACYVGLAVIAALAVTFPMLLVARFAHGVAAASVVVARSALRDLFSGRQLARVMSLTFIVFLMVPVIAPTLGQTLLWLAPWRGLFLVLAGFAAMVWIWALLRLPETLHPEYRFTLTGAHILHAAALVVRDRASVGYTLAVTALFGSILGYVALMQQMFAEVFRRPTLMPAVFAICAASMGVTAYLNSRIVERLGMRVISQSALLVYIAVTLIHTCIVALGLERLSTFILLQAATLACNGLTASNFGAMAMEPVGSVAGIAASLQGALSTSGGALIGALIGWQYRSSTLPLALGALLCGVFALGCVLLAEQGRLFRPRAGNAAVVPLVSES